MSTALSVSKSFSSRFSERNIHFHPFCPLSFEFHGFPRAQIPLNRRNAMSLTRSKIKKFVSLQTTRSSRARTETDEQLPETPDKAPALRFGDHSSPKEPNFNGANAQTGSNLFEEDDEKTEEKLNRESLLTHIEIRNELGNKADEVASTSSSEGGLSKESAVGGSLLAIFGIVAVLGGLGYFGYSFKDQINEFLMSFESRIDEFGPFGYPLFILGYTSLEILAVPAIPITMSAGLLFGPVTGSILCSFAGTLAAVASFLIARYIARDRILKLIEGNKKFAAIDKAIGKDSFRIVTMLRLSPLLPFSIGNYIYGLTSVELLPYTLGSWIGMLPGTWAYVSAGAFGRSLLQSDEGGLFSGDTGLWYIALGIIFTLGTGAYVTNVAKKAMQELDEE